MNITNWQGESAADAIGSIAAAWRLKWAAHPRDMIKY